MQKRHFTLANVYLSDNEETKLESRDQEASLSTSRNTMVDVESGHSSECLSKAISGSMDILKGLGCHLL